MKSISSDINVLDWFKYRNIITNSIYPPTWKSSYKCLGSPEDASPLYIGLNNYHCGCLYIDFYKNGHLISRQVSKRELELISAGSWLTHKVKAIIQEGSEICKSQKVLTDIREKIVLKKGFVISLYFKNEGQLLPFLIPALENLIKEYTNYVTQRPKRSNS